MQTQLPNSLPPRAPAEGSPTAADLPRLQAAVDRFMAEYLVASRPGYLRQTINAQLYEDAVEFVCRPGKRLRPVLFLLAHRIFRPPGQAVEERDLLAIATSLELLHGFILIHDDIIDRSELRRGRPTLHRVLESRLPTYADPARIGKNLSLVLGDILFALAQQCLLDTPSVPPATSLRLGRMLLTCLMETGFGETADIFYGTRDVAKIGLAEIEQMYLLKTTRYTIECPLAMAAALAGASDEAIAQIEKVARPAGLAFQVQNDLQEFERFEISDAEVPADFLEGKKTLLIHTAFELLGETDRALLQLCLSGASPSDASVSMAKELVTRSGAVACLRRRMQDLLEEAAAAASSEVFTAGQQAGLQALICLVRDAANRSSRPA
ncbi:MAG: polyprenyl synthetase family protein [Verrucomicrobia bacterium]|nr:polyprenyl synthetase family protein [Verrucomicrobiota bacterium]